MRFNYKYAVAGSIFIIIILIAFVWIFTTNQKIDNQPPLEGQLSKCQDKKTSYIGLTETEAIDKANTENYPYRIVKRDDVNFMVTADYSPSRLNFEIKDNLIKIVNCG